jgi:2-keto-4-pentenoate hydratase
VENERHRQLADALWQAETSRQPIEPLTEQHDDLVVEDAYAIQAINVRRKMDAGARVIGRKVGLTSKPMQQLLGVKEPDYGVLLDDM